MKLGRVASWFLLAFGAWSLLIWPRFLKAIWQDHRSWDNGPTSFFLVHLVLVVVSITAGLAIGAIGWRSLRSLRKMNA
ncbi:SCO4848 family membrane protein [Catenulispora subtropica]|uniref:Integral membrane protein n=1 Tax=Catenulispora subtropica TaxID=450798 RepID=A0ABN2T0F0_9ACTN